MLKPSPDRFGRLPLTQFAAYLYRFNQATNTENSGDIGSSSFTLTRSTNRPDVAGRVYSKYFDNAETIGSRTLTGTAQWFHANSTPTHWQNYKARWTDPTGSAGLTFVMVPTFSSSGTFDIVGATTTDANSLASNNVFRVYAVNGKLRFGHQHYTAGDQYTEFVEGGTLTAGHTYVVNATKHFMGSGHTEHVLRIYNTNTDVYSEVSQIATPTNGGTNATLKVGLDPTNTTGTNGLKIWDLRLETVACRDRFQFLHYVAQVASHRV